MMLLFIYRHVFPGGDEKFIVRCQKEFRIISEQRVDFVTKSRGVLYGKKKV
jgi:hypothetical protein